MEKWKGKVLDKLRDVGLQRAALESIPLELERLELERTAIHSSAAEDVKVKGSGGRQERLLWNMMQRQALEQNLQLARQYVAFVERGLAALEDEEVRVLERVYMRPEKDVIEHLTEEWGFAEKRSVYKRLDKIVYRLTLAMYGMEAS